MHVDYHEVTQLAVDLTEAGAAVGPQVQVAITKTGYDTVAGAQAIAPVDTGALKNSISVDIGAFEFTAGASVNYAGYVEYGTSEMAAQPYLGSVFGQQVQTFTDILGEIAAGVL